MYTLFDRRCQAVFDKNGDPPHLFLGPLKERAWPYVKTVTFLVNPDQLSALAIGATDIALRRHIPPDILTFTVTRLMFKRLCELDERSFLSKPFLQWLRQARGGRL